MSGRAPITVIRASSLSGYSDCPRRAAARIFKKEIEAAGHVLRDTPWGIGSVMGTAVHKAASTTLAEKARDGALPPTSVATDVAVESLHEGIRQGVMFDKLASEETRAERQTVSMTTAYHTTIAPRVEPILIEQRLEADVGNGMVLSGQADQIAREAGAIRDLKTGQRRGSYKPQFGSYSLLSRSHGIDIHHAFEDFVRRVGPRTEQPDPISYRHDVGAAETAAMAIIGRIAADINTWRHGDPQKRMGPFDVWSFPANPSSMLCSAKYCSAHGTSFCSEWRSEDKEDA